MSLFNLLLMCCFVGIAFAKSEAEVKQWFLKQGALCLDEFPVSSEELQQMHSHKVPDTRDAKCFITCIFKKAKWIDANGMFSEEDAVKTSEVDHADEPAKIENAKKLFALCKSVNEGTYSGADGDCERGTALAKCFIENAPKMGFVLPMP